MRVKINKKVAFFIEYRTDKKFKILSSPTLTAPIFCRHSLKLLSPTLPKLMNWILLPPPPLSADPDTPQNLECALIRDLNTYSATVQNVLKLGRRKTLA